MGALSSKDLTRTERSAILGAGVLALLLLAASGVQAAPGPLSLKVTPTLPQVGDPVLLEVRGDAEVHHVTVVFLGHVVPLDAVGEGRFRGIAPVGLHVKPGAKEVKIHSWQGRQGERRTMTVQLRVTPRRFDEEQLTVDGKFISAKRTPGLKARLARERREIKRAWRASREGAL